MEQRAQPEQERARSTVTSLARRRSSDDDVAVRVAGRPSSSLKSTRSSGPPEPPPRCPCRRGDEHRGDERRGTPVDEAARPMRRDRRDAARWHAPRATQSSCRSGDLQRRPDAGFLTGRAGLARLIARVHDRRPWVAREARSTGACGAPRKASRARARDVVAVPRVGEAALVELDASPCTADRARARRRTCDEDRRRRAHWRARCAALEQGRQLGGARHHAMKSQVSLPLTEACPCRGSQRVPRVRRSRSPTSWLASAVHRCARSACGRCRSRSATHDLRPLRQSVGAEDADRADLCHHARAVHERVFL